MAFYELRDIHLDDIYPEEHAFSYRQSCLPYRVLAQRIGRGSRVHHNLPYDHQLKHNLTRLIANTARKTMDKLPPKLLSDIIDLAATTQPFSYKPHLSPYAVVSRRWQRLVEAKQFTCIRITNDDIDTFASVFGDEATGRHRQAVLQELFLRVYSIFQSTKPRNESSIDERRDEVIANNTVFSRSLQLLFNTLRSWSLEYPLALYLIVPTNDSNGLSACRTEPRILALESLTRVSCVEKFVSRGQMHLPTETLVGVASKLPYLRHVDWQIADHDGSPALLVQRRQNRYGESTDSQSMTGCVETVSHSSKAH